MFAALAVANFRRYASGQALSRIGTWVETVAQALLALRLTHSGTILGLTTAARYAPILILSPYAGLLVDRYAKRYVLLATQTGLGLVSAALSVSVLTGGIRLWQVIVLALLFGTFSAVDNPARQAFVQEVVGRDLVLHRQRGQLWLRHRVPAQPRYPAPALGPAGPAQPGPATRRAALRGGRAGHRPAAADERWAPERSPAACTRPGQAAPESPG